MGLYEEGRVTMYNNEVAPGADRILILPLPNEELVEVHYRFINGRPIYDPLPPEALEFYEIVKVDMIVSKKRA